MKLKFNSDLYLSLIAIANAQGKPLASLIMAVLRDYSQQQQSNKESKINGAINK